jgi:hypothetical protein
LTNSAIFRIKSSARSDAAGRQWARLGLLAVFVGSRIVEPVGPESTLRVGGRSLPVLCPIRRLTGHHCPGCGMTRACILLFRLRIGMALRTNPFSPFLLGFLVIAAFGGSGRGNARLRVFFKRALRPGVMAAHLSLEEAVGVRVPGPQLTSPCKGVKSLC